MVTTKRRRPQKGDYERVSERELELVGLVSNYVHRCVDSHTQDLTNLIQSDYPFCYRAKSGCLVTGGRLGTASNTWMDGPARVAIYLF